MVATFAEGDWPAQFLTGWLRAEWITDTEVAFAAAPDPYSCGLFDVAKGQVVATHDLRHQRDSIPFLGVYSDHPVCIEWPEDSRRRGSASAHIIDLRDGSRFEWTVPPSSRVLQISPKCQHILLGRHADSFRSLELWLYEPATQKARRLESTLAGGPSRVALFAEKSTAFSPDGEWLVVHWLANPPGQWPQTMEAIHLASGKATVVQRGIESLGIARVSPNSALVTCPRSLRRIDVFSLTPSSASPVCVIDGGVYLRLRSHDWLGNDELIFHAQLLASRPAMDAIGEVLRKRDGTEEQTVWIADLRTKQIRMIWPTRWVHPTWRVLSGREWKEREP